MRFDFFQGVLDRASLASAALESLEEEIATGGPFKSHLFAIAFTCHYLFFSISSNEIWKLC